MRYIKTDKAPAAVGAYSQAVEQNGFLFISGQIPIEVGSGEAIESGLEKQVKVCLENLTVIANEAGYTKQDIAKVTIYTTKMEHFAEINSVYSDFFDDHKPARAVVGVTALPKGVPVEIEAICIKSS